MNELHYQSNPKKYKPANMTDRQEKKIKSNIDLGLNPNDQAC